MIVASKTKDLSIFYTKFKHEDEFLQNIIKFCEIEYIVKRWQKVET